MIDYLNSSRHLQGREVIPAFLETIITLVKGMNLNLRVILSLFTLSLLFASCHNFFNRANGSVEFIPYQGAQPGLVSGISNMPSDSIPQFRHAFFINDTIIGIIIDAQHVARSSISPYTMQPNDSIILVGPKVPKRIAKICGIHEPLHPNSKDSLIPVLRYVYRNNKPLGWIVGNDYKQYWPVEETRGMKLDTSAIANINNIILTSENDKNYLSRVHPKTIYRKTKPHVSARVGPKYEHTFGQRHTLYLVLPKAVQNQKSYEVIFQDKLDYLGKLGIEADMKELRSEAIHVSQPGYHTLQSPKHAYLSAWLGDGGSLSYPVGSSFYILTKRTNKIKYEGKISLSSSAGTIYFGEQFGPGDYNRTNVYRLNFSGFNDRGEYKIHIPSVGVSFPFSINDDIFKEAFKLQMKGFYHQRSGIKLEPPYTSYLRPRNQHPGDGVKIYACNKETFFSDSYSPEKTYINPFKRIANSIILDSTISDAWGGWMDATDYDRRYLHFQTVHGLIDTYETDKQYFSNFKLNIPESINEIPDIIDEATWGLDLFLRTQAEDGEIAYGIESVAHPSAGETSWNESLPLALVPGCPGIAYKYAAVASRVSKILREYDKDKANEYLTSARKAIEWADANINNPLYKNALPMDTWFFTDTYAFMYEATGESKWRKKFINSFNRLNKDNNFLINEQSFKGLYKYTKLVYSDDLIASAINKMILDKAESLLSLSGKLAYGEYEDFKYNCWISILYNSPILVAAYDITGSEKYIENMVKAGHYGMGANPLNTTFTTGLGKRFTYQWDDEALFTNTPFATGIPVYGPFPYYTDKELPDSDFFWDKKKVQLYWSTIYPSIDNWPMRETYFELMRIPAMNEFTVMQNMADQAFRWGFLSQYYHDKDL